MSQERHRVVIVGGGFGGIRATRALARTDVDITIMDRTNHHLFQPLLYQVATGILPDGLIAPALRSVVSKQANARGAGRRAAPGPGRPGRVATTDAKILLIEAGPQVLAAFAPKLQRYTQRRLQKMGVEVWLNTMARDMDSGSVTVTGPDGDRRVPARTRIWAAGVQASPLAAILAAATGADTDRVAAVFNWARALTFSKNRPHRTITYEHAQNELAEHHYQRE